MGGRLLQKKGIMGNVLAGALDDFYDSEVPMDEIEIIVKAKDEEDAETIVRGLIEREVYDIVGIEFL